jgi:hypothetical protein
MGQFSFFDADAPRTAQPIGFASRGAFSVSSTPRRTAGRRGFLICASSRAVPRAPTGVDDVLNLGARNSEGLPVYKNMAVVKHMAMNLVRSPKDKHSLMIRRPAAYRVLGRRGLWGARLFSSVMIQASAAFNPLTCSSTSAVLGSAGPVEFWRDFTGAPVACTWYPVGLANALNGSDLDPSNPRGICTRTSCGLVSS